MKSCSFGHVFIESDVQVVVNAIRNNYVLDSCLELIVADCISLITEILGCSLSFVRRSANRFAHSLARAFGSMFGPGEWFSNPPAFICDVLSDDIDQ